MDLELTGKVVLVLASSRGIGRAIAEKFSEEGANVVISSRTQEDLAKTAIDIEANTKNTVKYKVCDLRNAESIQALVQFTIKEFGSIDVLVNNAGGPPAGHFDDFEDEQWLDVFELNLMSMVRSIREVLPYMRQKGEGRILNVASSSIKQPIDGLILSNTFRMGIVGLAKSLSIELAKDGILINTLGPGLIHTDRIKELDQKNANKVGISLEEVQEINKGLIPLGRYGTAEEFAKMAVFLCSNANSYVTGQSFLVDGGMVKSF